MDCPACSLPMAAWIERIPRYSGATSAEDDLFDLRLWGCRLCGANWIMAQVDGVDLGLIRRHSRAKLELT